MGVWGCGSDDWQLCRKGYGLTNDDQCVEIVDPSVDAGESSPPVDNPDIEGDSAGECTDGADNNRDGLFDCEDPGCAGDEACSGDSSSADADVDADADADGGVAPTDTGVVEKYHPEGYAGARLHGPDTNDGVEDCLECHGTDLNGMDGPFPETEVNCDDCHEGLSEWRTNCTYCHGGEENSTGAPPREVNAREPEGPSSWSFQKHTIHVTDTNLKNGFECTECHQKPEDVFSMGHVLRGDDTPAVSEVDFSGGMSPEASWSAGSCSDLYCHGNGQEPNGEIVETGETQECNDCHPYEGDSMSALWSMSGEHQLHLELPETAGRPTGCAMCHSDVITDYDCGVDGDCITDSSLHLNKINDVKFDPAVTSSMEYNSVAQTCSSGGLNCHGPEPWVFSGGGPGGHK